MLDDLKIPFRSVGCIMYKTKVSGLFVRRLRIPVFQHPQDIFARFAIRRNAMIPFDRRRARHCRPPAPAAPDPDRSSYLARRSRRYWAPPSAFCVRVSRVDAQFAGGFRHQLHQPDRAFGRHGVRLETGLGFHHARAQTIRAASISSPPAPPDRPESVGAGWIGSPRLAWPQGQSAPARRAGAGDLFLSRSRRSQLAGISVTPPPAKIRTVPPSTSCRSACRRKPLPSTTILARPDRQRERSTAR